MNDWNEDLVSAQFVLSSYIDIVQESMSKLL